MIQLTGISKSYGGKTVLEDIELYIGADTRLGIVGKNGAGKSTLLKIIAGIEEPDEGRIIKKEGIKIGYLPQKDIVYHSELTLFEHLKRSHRELWTLEERLKRAEEEDPILYAKLIEEYREKDGFEIEAKIYKVLKILGFEEDSINKKVSEFSGGWQKRIKFAELLINEFDVLLLDEPTNNLDALGISWLIDYLKELKSAFIIVSHDRYLLDALTTETGELAKGRLRLYPEPYSKFIVMREEERKRKLKEYEETMELIARYKRFIERNKYDKKTAGRAKAREKMLERIKIPEKPEIEKYPEFRVKTSREHLPGEILRAEGIEKCFEEQCVLRGIEFLIRRGERIAILGENGSGKSTLLRILAGKLQPDKGRIKVAEGIVIGYYSQIEEEQIELDATLFELILQEREEITYQEIFTLLGVFGLDSEYLHKPLSQLSGGERQRVRLLLLFSRPRDLLILDEITNHLDLYSREALEKALLDFKGSIIFVSHDRYFTEKIANRYLLLKDGNLEEFIKSYEEYISYLKSLSEGKSNPSLLDKPSKPSSWYQWKELQKQKRRIKRQIERIKQEISSIETVIEKKEKELSMIEMRFASGKPRPEDFESYQKLRSYIENLYQRWELLEQELDILKKELD